MSIVLAGLLLGQSPSPGPIALVWKFSAGQEFFVEETQRQLYQVHRGSIQTTSYLDFMLLYRFTVKSVTPRRVTLEAVLERQKVNNPNEAGKQAIEALKQMEGAKAAVVLNRAQQGWELDQPPGRFLSSKQPFCAFIFALGTTQYEPAGTSEFGPMFMPVGDLGRIRLALQAQGKNRPGESRLRMELRGRMTFEPSATGQANQVRIQEVPSTTPGIGFFDPARGRWEYLDFRVNSAMNAKAVDVEVIVKQDFWCSYRVRAQRPTWE